MAIWNFLPALFGAGKELKESFSENAEAKGQRQHKENLANVGRDIASLQQFAAEFYQRNNRGALDKFVDFLNRLPRPLITFSVLGFFVLVPIYPDKFIKIANAYAIMPAGYWALLSVIITFYFGGRMQLKHQDMKFQKESVVAAEKLLREREAIKRIAEDDDNDESYESKIYDEAVITNKVDVRNQVVDEWLEENEEDDWS